MAALSYPIAHKKGSPMAALGRVVLALAALGRAAGDSVVAVAGHDVAAAAENVDECVILAVPQDCHYEGQFVCTSGAGWPGHSPDEVAGQGIFGYCHSPGKPPPGAEGASAAAAAAAAASAAAAAAAVLAIRGALDRAVPNVEDGTVAITGWAVDPTGPGGGTEPVTVTVNVDGRAVYTVCGNGRGHHFRPVLLRTAWPYSTPHTRGPP